MNRARRPVAVALAFTLFLLAAPQAGAQTSTHPAATGFPHFGIATTLSCVERLDGSTSGWIELGAQLSARAAGVKIDSATLIGLSGPRSWMSPNEPGHLVDTAEYYDLPLDSTPVRTAHVDPGDRFLVTYTARPVDGGRFLPPGGEQVDVRAISTGGGTLPLVEESCGYHHLASRAGVPPVQLAVDWDAGIAAQDAAIAAGLVLPTDWGAEFVRVLTDVCGYSLDLIPPADLVGKTMLEVDNGADVTVGVIGDSVTSQIRDELVADTRYNWVIASMCGARLDHFVDLGDEPDAGNLSFGLDAVLAADPDIVVVAVGSVDSKIPGRDNRPYIQAVTDRLGSVPCPVWMNAFVGTDNPDWSAGADRFNGQVAKVAAAQHVVQLDWHDAVLASGGGAPSPWLAPGPFDQLHVTVPLGHQARVGMTLGAVETCATPPAPPACASGLRDIADANPFCDEIAWLVGRGITAGYPDFTYRPTGTVSRQAMAAFLYRLSGSPPFVPPATATFTDVPTGHQFFTEIEWAAAEGVAGGFADGTFGAGAQVSRQAMVAFLYRLAGSPLFVPPATATFTDVPTGHPFFAEVEWAAANGITTGTSQTTFAPKAPVSRQAMAAFLQRFDALP